MLFLIKTLISKNKWILYIFKSIFLLFYIIILSLKNIKNKHFIYNIYNVCRKVKRMNNVEIKKYDAKIKEIDKIINTYSESKNLGIKLYYVPEIYSENKIDYIAIKSNDEFYKIPTIKYNDNPLYLIVGIL